MMRRIVSRLDRHGETYRRYRAANLERVAEFRRRQQDARFVRPERDLERLAHHGKLFVRDRIEKLLDPGTPFLELSSLAANGEYRVWVTNANREAITTGVAGSLKDGQFSVFPLNRTEKTKRGLTWARLGPGGLSDLVVADPDGGQLLVYRQQPDGTLAASRSTMVSADSSCGRPSALRGFGIGARR